MAPPYLTPSPLDDAERSALTPSLQPVLYGLISLASDCRQSASTLLGKAGRAPIVDLGYALDQSSAAVIAHMVALGLPVDARVEGAADNNPFDGTFSAGETDAAVLGAELLSRCRQLAVLIRAAFLEASTFDALETQLELQAVALAVSRFGGQLAQALR